MDNELIELIFAGDNIIFVTGGTIAIVAILFSAIKSMVIELFRPWTISLMITGKLIK